MSPRTMSSSIAQLALHAWEKTRWQRMRRAVGNQSSQRTFKTDFRLISLTFESWGSVIPLVCLCAGWWHFRTMWQDWPISVHSQGSALTWLDTSSKKSLDWLNIPKSFTPTMEKIYCKVNSGVPLQVESKHYCCDWSTKMSPESRVHWKFECTGERESWEVSLLSAALQKRTQTGQSCLEV